jgi:hypothetical protein
MALADQYGYRRNRSTTDHMFSILKILDKSGSTLRQYISYLQTSRKLVIQSRLKYDTVSS